MKYTIALFALAGAAIGQNNPDDNDYITNICFPNNSTGQPDFSAPCNALEAIQVACIYGPQYIDQISSRNLVARRGIMNRQADNEEPTQEQSNSTQQICVCESQFFAMYEGCKACYQKHGNSGFEPSADQVASLSSSYCAVGATPTQDFGGVLFDFATSISATLSPTPAPTNLSDPLGNRTQVSLYYTPSVTGTAAWLVVEQTASGSAAFGSVHTVDGQIRPTADSNNAAVASGSMTTGSTTTSGNAAMRTEAVAAVGVIGLAGIVALL